MIQKRAVPKEVIAALDRMCIPLHSSVISGATAEQDAANMKVIKDFIDSLEIEVEINPAPGILEDDFGILAGTLEAGNPVSGWILIEEDAEQPVPLDTRVLLGWWQEWPAREWCSAVGLAGSEKGGYRHWRATHWMPLPSPPVEAQRQEGGV